MSNDNNRHRLNRAKDMRASWAAYAQVPLNEVQLRDVLADLMHLAKAQGWDFDHELSMAADFFGDETAPAPDAPAEPMLTVYYECPSCGECWDEQWTSACDSKCGACGKGDIEAAHWLETAE